ncbi:hypothetical protein B0T09DRAFT_383207 [Sordaria sp. MPI-SDFR-AT-0083]|nr:hypothetical protein B0T09DRAFT_383207 [Sordaria sp. MPI-SDFR-AT-0083]
MANTSTKTVTEKPKQPPLPLPLPLPPSPPPSPDPLKNANAHHPQRPSTAGTELALRLSRRQASEALKEAQRAERAYTSRKRARLARANKVEAAAHFRQAKEHFALAVGLSWRWVRGVPCLIEQGWEERKRVWAEEKREEREKREEVVAVKDSKGKGEEGKGRRTGVWNWKGKETTTTKESVREVVGGSRSEDESEDIGGVGKGEHVRGGGG